MRCRRSVMRLVESPPTKTAHLPGPGSNKDAADPVDDQGMKQVFQLGNVLIQAVLGEVGVGAQI